MRTYVTDTLQSANFCRIQVDSHPESRMFLAQEVTTTCELMRWQGALLCFSRQLRVLGRFYIYGCSSTILPMGRTSNRKVGSTRSIGKRRKSAGTSRTTDLSVPTFRTDGLPNESNLWKALYELYELLDVRSNAEADYQAYFERNPVVFRTLGFDVHASFEKSSGNGLPFDHERNIKFEPDFLCARAENGELTVFELKTPFVGKLVTSRGDGLRAKLRESAARYVAQASEYAEFIQGNADARNEVKRVLSLNDISSVRATLVFGVAYENKPAVVARILARESLNVEVLFFDTLLERIGQAYEATHSGAVSRPGWCFVYLISFPESQPHGRTYISDCGNFDRDRVSFIKDGNLVIFECLDSHGRVHRLEGECAGAETHIVRFEFSNDEQGIYMSLQVDDEEKGLYIGKSPFDCQPDLTVRVQGADLNGNNGAVFNIFQTIARGRTLDLADKLGLYSWMCQKRVTSDSYLEYQSHSFMRAGVDGGLMQEIEELKPIHRPSGVRVGLIKSKVPLNAPRRPVIGAVLPVPPSVP